MHNFNTWGWTVLKWKFIVFSVFASLLFICRGDAGSFFIGQTYRVALPSGVTLQAIDGETLTSSTTMSNNFYTRNGYTVASGMSWDSPTFFAIGPFLSDYNSSNVPTAYTQMTALDWNTLLNWNTIDTTAVTTNSISVIGSYESGNLSAPNMVGINTYDEPPTYALGVSTPISSESNSVQDTRFWWVNLTINWVLGFLPSGIPAPSTAAHMLSNAVATPNATTRHMDLQSIDQYFFNASRDPGAYQYATINVQTYYGLGSGATPDQMARGSNYGDMIDAMRVYQAGNFPAPLGVYLETGEAYWDQAGFATNAATSTSSAILSFASLPPVLAAGYTCINHTTSTTLGTILSIGASTVTLTANSLGAVASGDQIAFVANSMVITPPEYNWAAWASIIHGARMIYIFDHNGPGTNSGAQTYISNNLTDTRNTFYTTVQSGQSVSMGAQVATTDALIKELSPIINAPFALGHTSVSPAGYTFPTLTKSLSGGIDTMVKWYHGGSFSNTIGGGPTTFTNGFYIFATTRYGEAASMPVSATFTVNDPSATSVNVVGESRSISISGGTFTDSFATASTVHIYQVIG